MQASFPFLELFVYFCFPVKINNQWVQKGHGKSLTFGNIVLFWLGGSVGRLVEAVSRFLSTLVVVGVVDPAEDKAAGVGTSGRKQRIF